MKILALLLSVALCSCNLGPPDKNNYKELDRIGELLSKKYHLNYLHAAIGGIVFSKKCIWALSLTSQELLTIEEGGALVKKIISDFLSEIEKAPVFKKYMKNESLDPNLFGFRLAFWNENTERPLSPYLAQIRFAENHVYFYFADPQTKALSAPIVKAKEEL